MQFSNIVYNSINFECIEISKYACKYFRITLYKSIYRCEICVTTSQKINKIKIFKNEFKTSIC